MGSTNTPRECFSVNLAGMSQRSLKTVFKRYASSRVGLESNQRGQVLLRTIRQRVGMFQESALMACQRLMFLARGFPRVVDGFMAPFDDVEAAKGLCVLGKAPLTAVMHAGDRSMLTC